MFETCADRSRSGAGVGRVAGDGQLRERWPCSGGVCGVQVRSPPFENDVSSAQSGVARNQSVVLVIEQTVAGVAGRDVGGTFRSEERRVGKERSDRLPARSCKPM